MDLFNCILNQGQVNSLLNVYKWKFEGIKGPVLAAITIQKNYWKFKAYTAYN